MYISGESFIGYVLCKYFLPVYGLSILSLQSVFYRAEVLNFKSSLSVIYFIYCVFCIISKESWPILRSSDFLLSNLLGVNSFVFTFRPVIHSELIFVRTVRSVSRFFLFYLLYVDVQLFQHHLLKRVSLLFCAALLSKISCLYLYESISGILILFQ